ncbi:hypothetical protein A9404_07755 [Halothiobacillus diazotrophicus]|uniref:Serine/threonine protein kinase n=1 Tax=Halothiobacillus diazotrophicus TaxID=1860122 RepID=A0A191ZHE8_9GAMM|nr:protein kinase [Halothiobacillus diazotrophicus]ANJ67290.1 hypothetical protein A9404_07755 [Halothiobacillus diazotrophicus]
MNQFGRYQILGEVGRGAMAIIYRGYDPKIARTLAIKTLRPEFSAHPEYRERFLTEAKAAGTLNHPHIVTVFDVGEVAGIPFIAMELLSGHTLDQFAARFPEGIPVPILLRIAIAIADALDFAHQHGVVHQDLKPENIALINDRGDIKMMDFGIARILPKADLPSTEGARAFLSGTPEYMSPEQIGDQPVDGRSDLYTLGVVLFELVTGQLPFRGDDPWSIWKQVMNQPTPQVRPLDPQTPPELLELIRTLLAKDPGQRYQSAAGVAADLRSMARRQTEMTQHWLARRIIPLRVRWPLLMAAVVAVTMVLGLIWVHQRQNQVISNLAFDYGFSLSEWVAMQTAEDLLLQDKLALQSWVDSMSKNRDIVYMAIDGRDTLPSVHSQAADLTRLMGAQLTADHVVRDRGAQRVYSVRQDDGTTYFVFESPIDYQGRVIGQLRIGLTTNALAEANHATLGTLMIWISVVFLVVMLGTYWFARRIQIPLDILLNAQEQVRVGRLDHRIRTRRRDEFAQIFAAYNAMVDALEARQVRSVGGGSGVPNAGLNTTSPEEPAQRATVRLPNPTAGKR